MGSYRYNKNRYKKNTTQTRQVYSYWVYADCGYTSKCWLWTGHRRRDRYTRIKISGKNYYLHRWMYEQHVGKISDGMEIDHLCSIRNCVNPNHLEAVSSKENAVRKWRRIMEERDK